MSAECKFELPIELLHLVERDLILTPVLLLGCDRLALDELTAQDLLANEDVQRIGYARAGGRRDQAIEQDEVSREPAMTCYIAVAGWPRVVPARSINGMQAMPLLPCLVEVAFGCKDYEVHVAEVVSLAARKRADQYDAEERRANGGLSKL